MFLLPAIALVVGITLFGCCWCSRRRIRPSVWVAVASTFVGSAIVGLVGTLMEPGPISLLWEQEGKTGLYFFPVWMGFSALITFLPAVIIVFLYQSDIKR